MNNGKKVRVRFAPSPTGDLHIGGLRVALYNWLFARQHDGKFILRIEDTDQSRYRPESLHSILEGLSWVGLDWDEGPAHEVHNSKFKIQSEGVPSEQSHIMQEKGECGPYFQSQRTELYQAHVKMLLEKGEAYYCFCTQERLAQMREAQEAAHMPPKYDKRCLQLSPDEVAQKLKEGIPYVVRLKVPEKGILEAEDLIRGIVSFDLALVDDQVLLKSDGYPTYHLANVVDDHLMEITHVLRGEDWLSSLPKHILLYRAFGWEIPLFGHLPLILAPDRTKLSKRHGAVSVLAFRALGYLPQSLLNFTLLLGWNPGKGSAQEIFSQEEMKSSFSLEGVQKSPAIFNQEKFDWMNAQYIRAMKPDTLAQLVMPQLLETGMMVALEGAEWVTADGRTINKEYVTRVVTLIQPRLVFPKEAVNISDFFFSAPQYAKALLEWKKTGFDAARAALIAVEGFLRALDEKEFVPEMEIKVKEWIAAQDLGTGEVLWPLRVALTGRDKSPSPFEAMWALGKEESLKRIQRALEKLS